MALPASEATVSAFLLVMGRVAGAVLASPFFKRGQVPALVRASLCFLLALFLAPLVGAEALRLDLVFPLRLTYEVLVGVFLGYLFTLVVSGVGMAGGILDFEMGFGLAHSFDPGSGSYASLLSRFYTLLAVLVFYLAGGHRLLVVSVLASYRVFPAGSLALPEIVSTASAKVAAEVFVVAVKVAAPVMGALFVADVVFGLVARSVPQLNVFVLGIPLKVLLGLLAVAVTMPATVVFLRHIFEGFEGWLAGAW